MSNLNSSTIVKEVDQYTLKWGFNLRKNRNEFSIKSKSSGKNFAIHTHFNLLDDNGSLIGAHPITNHVAEFIIKYFHIRGDTESFEIFESDLKTGNFVGGRQIKVSPDDVRHTKTPQEQSYTATGDKLLHHWPIFKKYKETGYGSIIRATMTFHQVCGSHCHYCSTISRNRADSITLDEAKKFVEALYDEQASFNIKNFPEYNSLYVRQTGSDIRLKGLIMSGGGQPNLWKGFPDFVNWISDLDIDLGLITNGFPPKIQEEIYEKMKWVRISITPEDASPHYVGGRFDKQYIPESIKHNQDVTVGYSYVYGPWTNDDILLRIADSIDSNGFDYCRLLTDCNLTRSAQLRAHKDLAERLYKLGFIGQDGKPLAKIFHQLKFHGSPNEVDHLWDEGQCYLQSYNVFWDTTGHEENGRSSCYACDSITVLAEENHDDSKILPSERRFNSEKWGTVYNDEVSRLFREPVKPFFDPRVICSACLFMPNNQSVKNLLHADNYDSIPLVDIDHINFP
jgi:pyruvate-formate lyase-activating enzyme